MWPGELAETILTWQAGGFWGRGWGGRQAGEERRVERGVLSRGGVAWGEGVGTGQGVDSGAERVVGTAWVNNVGPWHT